MAQAFTDGTQASSIPAHSSSSRDDPPASAYSDPSNVDDTVLRGGKVTASEDWADSRSPLEKRGGSQG